MDPLMIWAALVVGLGLSFKGLVHMLLGKYENWQREIVLIGKSAVFVGASYIMLGLLFSLIVLVGELPLLGMAIVVVGSILAEWIGESIYEGQDKSMDTVPKFKQKSKRKLKHDEKPKRVEKPKNGQLPY